MAFLTASDGCKLYHDVAGEGPGLLLISGLGGSAEFWAAPRKELARRFTTISFDHRGTGRSGGAEGPHSIAQVAADALSVLDALKSQQVMVAGHSTGGLVTQRLAQENGARFTRFVISGSWLKSDAKFRLLFQARKALLNAENWPNYQRLTYALGYPQDWIDSNIAEVEAAIASRPRSFAALSARIDMLLDVDLSDSTPKIVKPALVIGATDDAIVPFHHAGQVAGAIKGSTLRETDGGHFFPRTRTATFLDSVLPFLETA